MTTWVLRAEYKGHAGWIDWYNGRAPNTAEAQLLGQMNTFRVRSEQCAIYYWTDLDTLEVFSHTRRT
jgi:hypothetical protein